MTFIFGVAASNKYWAPYDEGIVTVAAEMILAGEIPYRDFFMAMYPPGQIYVLAALYKIFGISLATGRFYTVFVHVLIAMSIFGITRRLTKSNAISVIAWLISVTCLSMRLGTIPFSIWPGIALAIVALHLFIIYTKEEKFSYLVYSAIALGAGFLFRHDIALYAFLAVFISLFVLKAGRKNIFAFSAGTIVIPLPVFIYLVSKDALPDLLEALVFFPLVHDKIGSLPFPAPCFNLNMIFHQSLYFIKVNQYYIPLLVYAFSAFYLITVRRKPGKEKAMLLAVLLFGIFSFNQVRGRTDTAHLLTSIYPAVILFGVILKKSRIFSFRVFAVFLSLLFFLLVVKNADKSFKNILRKPYLRRVLPVNFDRGTVYIPKEEARDIENVVSYIKAGTLPDERIYVGNMAHRRDDFGGSTILYFLAGRLPATKYYELFPGLVTREKVWKEIEGSLSKDNVNVIVLQDVGCPEGDMPESALDRYIAENFRFLEKFGKYNIHGKI